MNTIENELLKKFNSGNATTEEQAEVLFTNTWIGTTEEKEKRKIEYVKNGGSFWDILNNY